MSSIEVEHASPLQPQIQIPNDLLQALEPAVDVAEVQVEFERQRETRNEDSEGAASESAQSSDSNSQEGEDQATSDSTVPDTLTNSNDHELVPQSTPLAEPTISEEEQVDLQAEATEEIDGAASASESNALEAETANVQETSSDIKERLVQKIANFEAKAEAVQALKDNLYSAIEQLHSETQQTEQAHTDNESEAEAECEIQTNSESITDSFLGGEESC